LGVLPIGVFTNSVNGLRPGTSYAYAFTAANEEGTVWSRTNTFTTTADAPVIVNVSASNITNSSAKLNALLLSDGGLPTWVYYRYGTDTNSWATTEIDGAKTQGELSQDVTDLMAGTTYYYQFAASNALGFVWAPAIDSLTTPYDVKLSGISIEDGVIIGVIENLTPGTPNVVERSFDLKQDTWTFVSNITSDSVSTNWFEPIKPEWTNVFYRVRRDL
jgi:hypothetical protein